MDNELIIVTFANLFAIELTCIACIMNIFAWVQQPTNDAHVANFAPIVCKKFWLQALTRAPL
jgi:hypothetical protein